MCVIFPSCLSQFDLSLLNFEKGEHNRSMDSKNSEG